MMMTYRNVLRTMAMLLVVVGTAAAQTPEAVQPAHDSLEPGTRTDDLGITNRHPGGASWPSLPSVARVSHRAGDRRASAGVLVAQPAGSAR